MSPGSVAPHRTVSHALRRDGLSRLLDLAPVDPFKGNKRPTRGDLIEVDIKNLRRFNWVGQLITRHRASQSRNRSVGWEFVLVCVDD